MRTSQRPVLTFAIWSSAFVVLTLFAGWQFGWFPGMEDASRHEVAREDEPLPPGRRFRSVEPPEAEPDDPIVFSGQWEPPLDDGPVARPQRDAADRDEPALAFRPDGRSDDADGAAPGRPFAHGSLTDREPPRPLGDRVEDARRIRPREDEAEPAAPRSIAAAAPSRRDVPEPSGILPAGHDEPPLGRRPEPVAEDLREIDRQIESGEYLAAHKMLSTIYWNEPERRPEIQERIDETARVIYFSPQPHLMNPYVVEPGDQLARIAQKYRVPWEYLARLNGVDPRRIRPGQRLKVIKGPFSAVVDLSDFELTVHAHGYYVRRYRVGIGKDGSTPLGRFTVQNKLVNPTYYGDDGEVIDADDPTNPLGDRWIDLGRSYGIHGTIEPESIGRAESRGCIRLLNEDVEELFDLLSLDSEVIIQP